MNRKFLTSLTAMALAATMVITSVQQAEARRYRGGGALALGIAATVIGGIALSRAYRHDRYYGGYGYGYGQRYYRSGYYGGGYGRYYNDDYYYRPVYRRAYYRPVYYHRPHRFNRHHGFRRAHFRRHHW
jgi:hypothetical protein